MDFVIGLYLVYLFCCIFSAYDIFDAGYNDRRSKWIDGQKYFEEYGPIRKVEFFYDDRKKNKGYEPLITANNYSLLMIFSKTI